MRFRSPQLSTGSVGAPQERSQDTISACLPAGDALAAQAEIATGTLLVHVLKKEDEQLNRKGAGAKQVSNAADTLNKTRGS